MSRTPRLSRSGLIAIAGSAVIAACATLPSGAIAATTYCMGQPANIVTTSGPDLDVRGNPYAVDVVALLGGNDSYIDDGSGDIVCLGPGNDRIQTTNLGGDLAGDDQIDGGTGDDVIYGFGGRDLVYGGDGNDYVVGSDGDDAVFGEAGNDTVIGGPGFDQVEGNGGPVDTCTGEIGFMGCETIFGGG
jgi:Ca2+-binding RTX toxin-like protein